MAGITQGGTVSLQNTKAGFGSALDTTAQANVAATVADKAQLLIAGEATKQATVMNQQIALPESADSTLDKRQVVTTAGNATRDITSYNVQNGETLSGIASKFGVTSSTIKWANNIDDVDALKPGQSLTILPISGLLYTVAAGDTADALASKYQSNAAQILSYNNAEVKGLTPGAQIIIPDGIKLEAPKPVVASAPAATRSYAPSLTSWGFSGNGYAYGYCTWYVATRRGIPGNWGNASSWYYNAQASGFGVGSTPVPGAIAWTPAGYYGHVAYVESVSGGMVTISEMNYNGNWGRRTTRTTSAGSFRYIY